MVTIITNLFQCNLIKKSAVSTFQFKNIRNSMRMKNQTFYFVGYSDQTPAVFKISQLSQFNYEKIFNGHENNAAFKSLKNGLGIPSV